MLIKELSQKEKKSTSIAIFVGEMVIKSHVASRRWKPQSNHEEEQPLVG
jgi:hypothetical protein